MNQTPDEKLDALLQQWADQPVGRGRVDDLHDRIMSASMSSAMPQVQGVRLERAPERPVKIASSAAKSRVVVGSVAVAVLVMMIAVSSHNIKTIPTGLESIPQYARFSPKQVSEKALLLREMNDVFDDGLVWMAETSNDLDFGLRQTNGTNVTDLNGDRLAVRIVVERRRPGSSAWEQFWTMDVVSHDEEFVTVSPQKDAGQQVQLWTFRLPDGAVAVECSLRLSDNETLLAETSGLHRDSIPLQVAAAHDDGAEYRVFQSVAELNKDVI